MPHCSLIDFNVEPCFPMICPTRSFGTSILSTTESHCQGGPPWPSDAISIESNGISNRSNRNSQKFSNGRKIARMARILTIFGRNRSSRRNLSFQKFSNERKIIESIESIDWIGRSIDRIDRWPPWYRFTSLFLFRFVFVSFCVPGVSQIRPAQHVEC